MNSKTWTRVIALTLFGVLAIPVQLAAQDKEDHHHKYHHYQIVDPGTFGGPQSGLELGGQGFGFTAGVINNHGTFVGAADTSMIDPLCFFNPDCHAEHAFAWHDGILADLGILPGGLNSQVNWISANGLAAGVADNGQMDPLAGIPQIRSVFWGHDGGITDLGALPGAYFANTTALNSRGEVVGFALNTIPDPYSLVGLGYQTRAFYWKDGVMQDLGTLGTGTDATAGLINERGQVAGWSYTSSSSTASPECLNDSAALTTGSFIWDKKNGMRDIGGLGGTCTVALDLNNQGQIVGGAALTGDQATHPFVWDPESGITDLGTLGGYGEAEAINDYGDVVGGSVTPEENSRTVLWRKRGGKWQKVNLGTVNGGGCSWGYSINASGQVVGDSGDFCSTLAFLWEDGGPMVDLNTLVSPYSGLQLVEAGQINDRGEITVNAADGNGNNHAVLLIPCDENHADVDGCDYSMVDASEDKVSPALAIQCPAALTPRGRMPGKLHRFRFPVGGRASGSGIVPAPATEQTLSANTATDDWVGDHMLNPQFQSSQGYCEVNQVGDVLDGLCRTQTAFSCPAQITASCPIGQPASSSQTIIFCNNNEFRLDTTRKCSSAGNTDFSLSASALTPATVSPGASSTSTVDVAAINGFTGSVALTCSVQPSPVLAPTCSISPGSIPPGTPATLTVRTTGPTAAVVSSRASSGLFYALCLPLIGLVAARVGLSSEPKRRKGKLIAATLVCMLFAGLVFQVACGGSSNTGGGGSSGTPAGTYTITVIGTNASGSLKPSAAPTLTVQ